MFRSVLALAAALLPFAALAQETVSEREKFVGLVSGKTLTLRLLGVALEVRDDGTIVGEARGDPVTGTWTWQDGYFCREMDWSGTEIPYNCQLVEREGDLLRFTSDKGAGESAAFGLR